VIVTDEMLKKLKASLPELPEARKHRFISDLGLSVSDAEMLTDTRAMADYFEAVYKGVGNAKAVANMVITEVRRVLNERGGEIENFPVDPDRLAGVIRLKEEDKISSSAMQTVFNAMLDDSRDAHTIAGELNLMQVSDTSFLEPMVDEILTANPDKVNAYLAGKTGLMGFFVGQIMQKSQGKANPKLVSEMIIRKMSEQGA
jgi:aspartyl-tRNA(Asn)/glutamyl-tRNA(Gln) amidotransferase subunit B